MTARRQTSEEVPKRAEEVAVEEEEVASLRRQGLREEAEAGVVQ